MSKSKNWTDLVQSITDGEAILVLGPDAIPFYRGEKETSFRVIAQDEIFKTLPQGISHYYQRDSLFQFQDAAAKQQAMKCIREVARSNKWIPDSELLRQIIAIPFPVIINLSPAKYLFDAFSYYWREPQFDYFTTKDKPVLPDLSYPTGQDNPLIFQLAGSVIDKRDSVILDYHDLFEVLKNLLSDIGVSEQLRRKLQEADRFILLGFELDRWYAQMFLHYINRLDSNPFSNYNQNVPILSDVSEDNREFIVRQFKIEHHSLSRKDFDQIYQECNQKGILRKLLNPSSSVAHLIRKLLIQNKFEEAFNQLEQNLEQSEINIDMALLRARYTLYLNEKNLVLKDEKELSLELNKIRYTLLTYANQIGLG